MTRPVFATGGSGQLVPVLLWLGVIGFLVRTSVFMRVRATSAFASVDRLAFVQICIIVSLVALLAASARLRPALRNLSASSGGLLLAYYLLCAVSGLWSPIPEYSSYRAVEVTALMLAVFVALSYSSGFGSAESTVLGICLLALILGPLGWARLRSWNLWSDNGSTASAAMILCYCVGEFSTRARRRKWILCLLGAIALAFAVVMGGSASLIALACGITVIAFVSPRHRYLLAVIVAGLVATWFYGEYVFQVFFRGKTVENIQSLHGRVSMWEDLMASVASNPLYGQGFAVTARLAGRNNTHSGLLAVLTGTGALGVMIVTWGLVRLAQEFFRSTRAYRPGAVGCAAALTTGLINCVSVPVIGEYWRPETLVFTCFLALHLFYVRRPPVRTWPQACRPIDAPSGPFGLSRVQHSRCS